MAVGWTPCIGPVLGAILAMGASTQDVAAATFLLLAYSAGLAVPFLLAAAFLPRVQPLLGGCERMNDRSASSPAWRSWAWAS